MWLIYFIVMPLYIMYLMVKMFVFLFQMLFGVIVWLFDRGWDD